MYYSDLSVFPDKDVISRLVVLSIGWLDADHRYKQGEVPEAFLKNLWDFCNEPVIYTLGFQQCPFCTTSNYATTEQRDDKQLLLGSAEIRVFGQGNNVFAAPDLIYHYVAVHSYRPPDEFINAVLAGPLAGTKEYDARIRQGGWLSR
jgi:hypothetical protein